MHVDQARADGRDQPAGRVRGEQQHDVVGRLLEELQQRVGRVMGREIDVAQQQHAHAAAVRFERELPHDVARAQLVAFVEAHGGVLTADLEGADELDEVRVTRIGSGLEELARRADAAVSEHRVVGCFT